MNFRSVAQLSDQLIQWSKGLPQDFELVVGLPRSGLLAANLLALYRNLPVADLDGVLAGRTIGAGTTRVDPFGEVEPRGACDPARSPAAERFLDRPRKVLVLDDSTYSGDSLRLARKQVEAAELDHHVEYGAVYVTPETISVADHHCEVLGHPRCFEWNVLHHHVLSRACVDLDSVLCVDLPQPTGADDAAYRSALRTARPRHAITAYIGQLVTDRPERYRAETERWLDEQRIAYGDLVMARTGAGPRLRDLHASGAHKASVYRDGSATFFVGGDIGLAVEIANLSRRAVLSTDTMQMIQPGALPVARPGLALVDDTAPSRPKRLARSIVPRPARVGLDRVRRRLARAS